MGRWVGKCAVAARGAGYLPVACLPPAALPACLPYLPDHTSYYAADDASHDAITAFADDASFISLPLIRHYATRHATLPRFALLMLFD